MPNMTFYIKPENEKPLKKLEDSSMGGLINHLLEKYFETHTKTITKTFTIAHSKEEQDSIRKNTEEVDHVTYFKGK